MFAITAMVPAVAQANAVDDLVKGLLGGGGGGATGGGETAGGGQPDSRAGAPPNYTPPAHGSNPHGQGSVGVVDLTPNNNLPQSGDPATGDEDITIGAARGEQNGSAYHGRIYLLHANILNLINTDSILPPVETDPGQTATPPLAGLQTIIDDNICPVLTSPDGCVELLPINSSTTTTGSQNSFGVAGTDLTIEGIVGLQTGVATSQGNIQESGGCQTADGSSNVADAETNLLVLPTISADALESSSSSTACNNGTQSQTSSSKVVELQGTGLGLPAAGCANGTPDTPFTALVPLIGLVCNADDSSNTGGTQNSPPFGVREALTVTALQLIGDPLAKATTAAAESHAVAPAAQSGGSTLPPGNTSGPGGGTGGAGGGGGGGGGNNGGPGAGAGGPGGPATTVAQPGGELAFTGSNLLVLALLGGALILGGIGFARASTRRHSRATA